MYEAFYGLREKPFNLTPDPKFLYLSEKHKEAFAHLLFGIKNRSGFVMVTGEIGTGKTTICRTLLNQLDENTEVAFIFNPYLSPDELLRKINEDFGIKSKAATVRGLIDELNAYLLNRNAKGKNCVLVIDEAQNLTPVVLEQIRLLSNLETETTKLLQIVLIGQPELMQHLSLDELRQLNQRITARYHLEPLDRKETLQYIAYRLRVAGGRRRIHFEPGAVKQVFRYSGGTPRVINAICDRALLIGYTKETRDISAATIHKAWKEIRGEKPKAGKGGRSGLRKLVRIPAVLAAVALLVLAGKLGFDFMKGRAGAGGTGIYQVFASLNPFQAATPPVQARSREDGPASPGVPAATVTPPAVPKDEASMVEHPVEEQAPPAEEQFDPTFAGLIDRLNPAVSRNAAVVGMLRAWNLALLTSYPANDSVESLEAFAKESRLSCEVLTLTLDQVEAINLPALVRLHGKHQSIWSAIVGVEFDDLRITTGMAETTLIPRDAFEECYQNEALLFWRDPNPDEPLLKPSATGEDVRVLQVQLRALGRMKEKPTGIYDAATAKAVSKLQSETGLPVDGVLGSQTRMVLYSWLPGFATPALRPLPPLMLGSEEDRNDTAPPKSPVSVASQPPSATAPPAPPKEAAPPAETKPSSPAPAQPAAAAGGAETKRPETPATAQGTPPSAVAPATVPLPTAPPPVPQGPIDPFRSQGEPSVTSQDLNKPGEESAAAAPDGAPPAEGSTSDDKTGAAEKPSSEGPKTSENPAPASAEAKTPEAASTQPKAAEAESSEAKTAEPGSIGSKPAETVKSGESQAAAPSKTKETGQAAPSGTSAPLVPGKDTAASKNVTPPSTGGLPLVPSDLNKAPESEKR